MSAAPDITSILEELAAGRIGAAEAARQIDALSSAPAPQAADLPEHAPPTPVEDGPTDPGEPAAPQPVVVAASAPETSAPLTDSTPPSAPDGDAWAAATDRPQQATFTTERFGPPDVPVDAPASGAPASASPAAGGSATAAPSPAAAGTPAAAPSGAPAPAGSAGRRPTGGVERISVRAVGRRVRIVGETAVATVSADGPHVLRRNGSVLEVSSEGDVKSSLDGFSILKATRSINDIRSLKLGKELFLRVNPDLVVDVEVTAGTLSTEDVPRLGRVRVTAGSARMTGVREVNDALVQAGQATISGSITTGRSRVRAESGNVVVELADDSNVTVRSESQLGRVGWSGGHSGAGDEVVMGNGSARLDVEVVMGHATVKVGSTPTSAER